MTITEKGFAIIDGDSHISKWVVESGRLDHDRTVEEHILPHIEPHSVVVDAGANVGDHSIRYAEKASKVMAFEPNPQLFECLQYNLQNYVNVECYRLALSCGVQECELVTCANVGAGYLQPKRGGTVVCVPLDAFNLKRLDFFKLDIEGYELYALEGAKTTISIHRPKILLEMNRGTLVRNGVQYQDIFEFLRSMEYDWRPLADDNRLEDDQYDLLATPRTTTG